MSDSDSSRPNTSNGRASAVARPPGAQIRRRAGGSQASRPNSTRAAGAGGSSGTMLKLYTDDSPGLRVDPYVVLILSLAFIGSIFFLHISAKLIRLFTKYNYCANVPAVANAVRILASSPFLIVDCEGKNLGAADGVLSLMCIGTANAEHVFLFDVLALQSRNALAWLRLVLDLLADPNVKKIMWDCRNDFLEISATYHVLLQGVLDLQLAEINSRTSVRGEKEWKRISRLAAGGRRLPLPLIKQNPDLFSGVHSLQGMDACLREARLLTTGKDPQVVAMHKTNGSLIWLSRPLLPQLLQYAAHDIEMMGALYEHFKAQSWITPVNEDALVAQSMRYAHSLYYQGRVADDDVFGSSSVLPLDVLREPRGLTVPCQGCNRMQSLHCFTTNRRGRKIVARTNICRVCQIKLLIRQVNHPVSWVNVTTFASGIALCFTEIC